MTISERSYRLLMGVAITLSVLWIAWTVVDSYVLSREPGDMAYLTGNQRFADGQYAQALESYNEALAREADHVYALRGKARALMQLGRDQEALEAFDRAILRSPEFGATYANRGILRDRMGDYRGAAEDYEKALSLNPELADGPHWLTRFLRNQAEAPPTIADRARYLEKQLALPESERVLRKPQEDAKQRPYKL